MSKTDKMRDRLASIQRDREAFEKQKKELEADMHVGKKNMTKIQKGLKNKSIADESIVLDEKVVKQPAVGACADSPYGAPRKSRRSLTPTGGSGQNNGDHSPTGQPTTSTAFPFPPQGSTPMMGRHGAQRATTADSRDNSLSPRNPLAGASHLNIIMPSGPRVSEWCYTAPLDTIPPVVKSRALYENVRHLGRGAFGEVSLVKNVEDNKLFAVKSQLCPKDSEFQSVLHEIRFLRANRHPCIIDVHDAFLMLNPRVVHIVMHYCESGNLSSALASARKNRTNFSETQIIKWTFQLALALQFLHENHTIHRDLKPMNVMLTEGGEHVKVCDFGLAMKIDDTKEQDAVDEAGTPYYTAPEMIMREPYSYPADCWSFGVIVHQLLSLERPFEGSSTAELVKAILTGNPPALPPHYSEDLKLISFYLLRREPSQRLSMTDLLSNPIIYPKAAGFPQAYRPRALEERIRRSHTKQLEAQMEAITANRRSVVSLQERTKALENFDKELGIEVLVVSSSDGMEGGSASGPGSPADALLGGGMGKQGRNSSAMLLAASSKSSVSATAVNSSNAGSPGPSQSASSTPTPAGGAAAGGAGTSGISGGPVGGITSITSVSEDVSVDDMPGVACQSFSQRNTDNGGSAADDGNSAADISRNIGEGGEKGGENGGESSSTQPPTDSSTETEAAAAEAAALTSIGSIDPTLLGSRSVDSSPRAGVTGVTVGLAGKGVIPPRKPKSPRSLGSSSHVSVDKPVAAPDVGGELEGKPEASDEAVGGKGSEGAGGEGGGSGGGRGGGGLVEAELASEGLPSGEQPPPHVRGGHKGLELARARETDEYFEHQIEEAGSPEAVAAALSPAGTTNTNAGTVAAPNPGAATNDDTILGSHEAQEA